MNKSPAMARLIAPMLFRAPFQYLWVLIRFATDLDLAGADRVSYPFKLVKPELEGYVS